MTTRATSIKAWQEMIDSGAIKSQQAKVLKAVIDHGPATSGEIYVADDLGDNLNLVRARFTELVGRGLIREIGQRRCKISGRTALVWEFTGRTKPLELERGRKITDAQRKRVRGAIAGITANANAVNDESIDAVIQAARAR